MTRGQILIGYLNEAGIDSLNLRRRIRANAPSFLSGVGHDLIKHSLLFFGELDSHSNLLSRLTGITLHAFPLGKSIKTLFSGLFPENIIKIKKGDQTVIGLILI